MRLRIINPNTSAAMTASIGRCAAEVASPGWRVEAVNPTMGPASIESHYDEALAVPGLLTEVRRGVTEGVDGFVVACFGDPGLDAARESADGRPVVGIAQAAMHMASLVGRTFGVVTTLERTVGTAWDLVRRYGFERSCLEIVACEIPVLDLDEDDPGPVLEASADLVARRGVDALVLGCAGMAAMARVISAKVGVPVVDGVAAATTLVEAMVRCGVGGATTGEYAPPPAKPYTGLLAGFALPG